ncbi:MAG: DUF2683 family protein [Nanoarchaeota archaeon]|nr:DUF2683 family protein [Nanoarchaeota archaeon]
MTQTIQFRAELEDYSNRVLGVIKEKFGLKDKSEALKKFVDMYGEEFVEREVKDEVVRDIIKSCEAWEKKHQFKRKMTFKELDELCDI